MCDPMHIEREFDRFMGRGCFRIFSKSLDTLFQKYIRTQEIPPSEIKKIMKVLPDFLNKKCDYSLQNEIYTQGEKNRIVFNFNRIWNSLQSEYQSYFSAEDINNIARRAGYSVQSYD